MVNEAYQPTQGDVQDFYDMRLLTPGVTPKDALEDAQAKFGVPDLKVDPNGQVSSPKLQPDPAPAPPADAGASGGAPAF